jgi:hypothetical protein
MWTKPWKLLSYIAKVLGVGVGLIFVKTSVLLFVASILTGIRLGLVIAPFIPGS